MTTAVLDYQSDAIIELMSVPEQDWDLNRLKEALQRAIMLELATIPPYATALWSITDPAPEDTGSVYHAIRSIVFDEMAHFGLVCNILTSLGGEVVLTGPASVPKYPGKLPGGVRPQLTIHLSGLSRQSAASFAEIEEPESPLAYADDATSIGAFYDRISAVVPRFAHLLTGQRQVTFPLSRKHNIGNDLIAMQSLTDVLCSIRIIKAQGEGSTASPQNPFPGQKGELAHYYRFREIAKGRKLIEKDGTWSFEGEKVAMPATFPAAPVPEGGWAKDERNKPDESTAKLLRDFNVRYSGMLRCLEAAWAEGTADRAAELRTAIKHMGDMRTVARKIMAVHLPSDPGKVYGPEFLYLPA